jgi:type IV pilus assembly protein PilA
MKKQQSGFTLIELMIVVAIIGILAAIAIPSYMDYTKKAKVSELLLAASPAKATASEYTVMAQTLPSTKVEAGIVDSTNPTALISSIIWSVAGAQIEVKAHPTDIGDLVLELKPTLNEDGSVSWVCTSRGTEAALAPSSCR